MTANTEIFDARASRFQIFMGGGGEGMPPDPRRGKGHHSPFSSHWCQLNLQWPLITNLKVIKTPVYSRRSQVRIPLKP